MIKTAESCYEGWENSCRTEHVAYCIICAPEIFTVTLISAEG